MKLQNNRIISFITILSIIIGISQSVSAGKYMETIIDPFAKMYDSDAIVSNELIERKSSIEADAEHEATLPTRNVDLSSGLNTTKEALVQQLTDEIEDELNDNYRHDRYIVKYKSKSHPGINSIISNGRFQINEVVPIGNETTERIMLVDKVNPAEFADLLRSNNSELQIEYIQPDFKLSPDGLSMNVIDSSKPDAMIESISEPIEQSDGFEKASNDSIIIEELIIENIDNEANYDKSEIIDSENDDNYDIDNGELEDIEEADELEEVEEAKEIEDYEVTKNEDEDDNSLIEIHNKNPVLIAVIDTGVDSSHNMLQGYIADGWDFVNNTNVIYDPAYPLASAHGTHICGIIAQIAQETDAAVQIMPLKVFENGVAYTSDVIAAIIYAADHGADIINCSFGSTYDNPALYEAISNTNALFVCAAGNFRRDLDIAPTYPSSYRLPNIISVASVNANGAFSYFSNYSPNLVDITAVGRDVYSALPNNETGPLTGTSMSAAYVSGAAAAVCAAAGTNGRQAPESIRDALLYSADHLSNLQNKVSGGRRANLYNSVSGINGDDLDLSPEDDYDVHGYQPDEGELLRLFSGNSYTKVEGEYYHSIALSGYGELWAWGYNGYGQLGDGTTVDSNKPIPVLLSNVIDISAGNGYNLAVKSDGTVWSWGVNYSGQLGDGSTVDRAIPVQAPGLTGVVSVAAGDNNSLALKNDGTVWAWGSNYNGTLGDGTWSGKMSPVQVSGLTNVAAISVGGSRCYALKEDGAVWAWGLNGNGLLGIGTTTSVNIPTQLNNLDGITKITAGRYSCFAIKENGAVYAWGDNSYGQLGDGTTADRSIPVQVISLNNVSAIIAGKFHSIALKNDGTVWAWGNNVCGQLGDGTIINNATPSQINSLSGINYVASKGDHSLVIKNDNTVWSWGYNSYGQLGVGSYLGSKIPVQVGLPVITTINIPADISTWGSHTLKIDSDGVLWAWGINNQGQLGNGTNQQEIIPIMQSLTNIVNVASGLQHSLALKNDGTVWSWGGNSYGQLGDGTVIDKNTPLQIPGLYGVVSIAAGFYHSIVLKDDGTVWALGSNGGVVGDGTILKRASPVQVINLTNVIAISAGAYYNLACKSDGTVWAWGSNYNGELGDGTNTDRTAPVQVSNLTNIDTIIAGGYHSIALNRNGTIWVWGKNNYGQLGDGTLINKNTPVQIDCITDIISISAGRMHSLAVKTDGTVWGWGFNAVGQLGNGSHSNSVYPVQVSNLSNVVMVSAGEDNSRAMKTDGSMWAWGYNASGELGDGTTVSKNTPVEITFLSRKKTIINIVQNQSIIIAINASKVETFINNGNPMPFNFEYDPSDIQLDDFAIQTVAPIVNAGYVPDTPLSIISHSNGVLVFTVDMDIPIGSDWSGVLTYMRFSALKTGMTSISLS